MHALDFLAGFIALHIAFGPSQHPMRVTYNYCLAGPNGPVGWAETKDAIDTDFARYSRGADQDNCDVIARRLVEAHFNF